VLTRIDDVYFISVACLDKLTRNSFVVGISLFTDARRLAKSNILSLQNFIGFHRWVSIAL